MVIGEYGEPFLVELWLKVVDGPEKKGGVSSPAK